MAACILRFRSSQSTLDNNTSSLHLRRTALTFRSETHARRIWLTLGLVGVLQCPGWAQTSDSKAPSEKVKKEFYSAKDRVAAMQSASIFSPKATAMANILEGPEQNKKQFQLHFGDKVLCDFETPGKKMGGKTPKFECKITRVESANGQVQTLNSEMDEEPVKVKFGADDREVYAEVVATRLMWALGYYADSWFPVRVECHNCPEDPVSGSGARGTRLFDPATVVRKYPGHKMY